MPHEWKPSRYDTRGAVAPGPSLRRPHRTGRTRAPTEAGADARQQLWTWVRTAQRTGRLLGAPEATGDGGETYWPEWVSVTRLHQEALDRGIRISKAKLSVEIIKIFKGVEKKNRTEMVQITKELRYWRTHRVYRVGPFLTGTLDSPHHAVLE